MNLGQYLIDLILQPGSSLKLIPVINVSIALLLIVLLIVGLTNSELASIHLVVMSSLALGLLLSVNWFFIEFQKVKNSQHHDKSS